MSFNGSAEREGTEAVRLIDSTVLGISRFPGVLSTRPMGASVVEKWQLPDGSHFFALNNPFEHVTRTPSAEDIDEVRKSTTALATLSPVEQLLNREAFQRKRPLPNPACRIALYQESLARKMAEAQQVVQSSQF